MGYEQLMQGVVVVLTTPILWETHRHPVMFPQAPNGYPVGIPSESLLTTCTRMEPLQSNGKSQMPLMGIQYPPMGIPWESSGDPSGIPVRNNQGIPIRIPLEPHSYNNPNGTQYVLQSVIHSVIQSVMHSVIQSVIQYVLQSVMQSVMHSVMHLYYSL